MTMELSMAIAVGAALFARGSSASRQSCGRRLRAVNSRSRVRIAVQPRPDELDARSEAWN